MLGTSLVFVVAIAIFVVIVIWAGAVIVPQKQQYVVERLGKFHATLDAGFHVVIPFFDRVSYRFSMKEQVLDTPSQICITSDNVTVAVDGLIYIQVQDAMVAAYGIEDYRLAASQLAQTSLRSAIGKIELDRTFEERESINAQVVAAVDEAAATWGIKVLRFEIKDITPPESVKMAMETQMTAEREKRAAIAKSEGQKVATINAAEAIKQDEILRSEGQKMRLINEAEGHAQHIEMVAAATARGLREVSGALAEPGGELAANLRVAESFVKQFGELAKETNTMILPGNMADVAGTVAAAMKAVKIVK